MNSSQNSARNRGFLAGTTYHADPEHVHATLRPYTWYVKHVVVGAEEAGLPADYINNLKGVESVIDPDPEREKRELSIHETD